MKLGFFSNILLIGLSVAVAHADPIMPEPYGSDVRQSQNYNTPYHQEFVFSPEQANPVPIYHFDIPASEAKTFLSHLDEAMRKQVLIQSEGKSFVRFFIVDHPDSHFSEIRKALEQSHIPLGQKYWGVWTQSTFTYFVWDPSNASQEPFFLKIPRFRPGLETSNTAKEGESAVRVDQVVEDLFHEHPDEFVGVLPERLANSTTIAGVEFTNLFRSVQDFRSNDPSIKLWTSNGFFGSDKLAQAAKSAGMTPDQWITKEYLPALAKFSSRMNWRYGLYPEVHGQNLLVGVNEKTGKIAKIRVKDLSDILIDPSTLAALGKERLLAPLKDFKFVGRTNITFTQNLSRFPGYHHALFTGQGVYMMTKDPEAQRRYAVSFIENYIEETQKITGKKIQLSPAVQKKWDDFRTGHLDAWWKNGPFSNEIDNPNFHYMAELMTDIHQQVAQTQLPVLKPEMEDYDSKAMAKIFESAFDRVEVAFPFQKSVDSYIKGRREDMLHYAFDGKSLIAFQGEGKSRQIIGYAFSLTPEERNELASARLAGASCVTRSLSERYPATY